jgi:cell cycle checkpoint protein
MGQFPSSDNNSQLQAVVPTFLSRDDVLLHHLPYMSKIWGNVQDAKELEEITQFRGLAIPRDDVPGDELDDIGPSSINDWTTDPVKTEKHHLRPGPITRGSLEPNPPPVEEAVEKLVLSDDDIED